MLIGNSSFLNNTRSWTVTVLFFLQLKLHGKLKTYHFSPVSLPIIKIAFKKISFSVDLMSCETELDIIWRTRLSFLVCHSRDLQAYLFQLCLNPKDLGISTSLSINQEASGFMITVFKCLLCLFAVDSGVEYRQSPFFSLESQGYSSNKDMRTSLLSCWLVGRQREWMCCSHVAVGVTRKDVLEVMRVE